VLAFSPIDVQVNATNVPPADVERIVRVLQHHNDRIYKVTIISTLVVSLAALLNSYRLMRQLKRDEAILRRSSR
jgi:hypothetical protein